MKIIDSHVHLNLQQFDNDREEVFKRIEEKLDFVVNIGVGGDCKVFGLWL